MRSAEEQRKSDRILAGICSGVFLLWLALTTIIFFQIRHPPLFGIDFVILPMMAGLLAILALFFVSLIAMGILMCAAWVLS